MAMIGPRPSISMAETDDTWRTRNFAPKVKTGCQTCKKRHIKCGEEKPICMRCSKKGLPCIYGTTRDGRSSRQHNANALVVRAVNPIASLLNSEQSDLFDYFRLRTVPELMGYFKTSFWSQLCFQAGQTEPAIRDGMLALSAYHRSTKSDSPQLAVAKSRRYIFDHYDKAIKAVMRTPKRSDVINTTLICCMIFFSLELYLNNFGNACVHVENGLRILREARYNNVKLDEGLEQMYIRMDLQLSAISPDRQPKLYEAFVEETPDPTDIKLFKTVEEARAALDKIRQSMHYFVKERLGALRNSNLTEIPADIRTAHGNLKVKLELWGAAFDVFCADVNIPGDGFVPPSPATSTSSMGRSFSTSSAGSQLEVDDVDRPSTCLLGIYHRLSTILTATLFSKQGEYDYTIHESYFHDIVKFATYIRDHFENMKSANPRNEAQFDMDVKPPIVFVLQKCTNDEIRQRAHVLLNSRVMFPDDEIIPEAVNYIGSPDIVEHAVSPLEEVSPVNHFEPIISSDVPSHEYFGDIMNQLDYNELQNAYGYPSGFDFDTILQSNDASGITYDPFPNAKSPIMEITEALEDQIIESPTSDNTYNHMTLHRQTSTSNSSSAHSPPAAPHNNNSLFLVDPAVEWWINRMSRILLSPHLRNMIWQQSRPKEMFEMNMENKFVVTEELLQCWRMCGEDVSMMDLQRDMGMGWVMPEGMTS